MESAGALFRQAVADEVPLQVPGAVNAYTAMMAEKTGFSVLVLQTSPVQLLTCTLSCPNVHG